MVDVKEKSIYALRWLAILPAAVVIYLGAYYIFAGLGLFSPYSSWLDRYVYPAAAGGIAGYAFVKTAYMIAPASKMVAALVSAILMVVIMIGLLILGFPQRVGLGVLVVIASAVGSIIGYILIDPPPHRH